MLDAQVLDRTAERPEPAAAVVGQLAQLAALDRIDVGGFVCRCHHRYASAASSHRVAYRVGLGQSFDFAVDAETVGMAVTVLRDKAEDVLLVLPHHGRGTEVLAVLEVAVAGDLDVEPAVGGKPLGFASVSDVELDVGPSRELRVADAKKRDLLRRRPGQVEHAAAEGRDLLRIALCGRDHPDRGQLLQAGVLAQVGKKSDVLAVRRPHGGVDVVCRRGDPSGLAAIDVGDPRAGELVADAHAIEAPGVVADAPGRRIVGAADDEALLA